MMNTSRRRGRGQTLSVGITLLIGVGQVCILCIGWLRVARLRVLGLSQGRLRIRWFIFLGELAALAAVRGRLAVLLGMLL